MVLGLGSSLTTSGSVSASEFEFAGRMDGYKPLPQVPPASALPSPPSSSFSRPLAQATNHEDSSLREGHRDQVRERELLAEGRQEEAHELSELSLDLQNRHQRPRTGSPYSYSPQTPTIYEYEEDAKARLLGHEYSDNSKMSGNAYEESDGMYGSQGVAADYGRGANVGYEAPAKEARRGDRIALYVALVSALPTSS